MVVVMEIEIDVFLGFLGLMYEIRNFGGLLLQQIGFGVMGELMIFFFFGVI